MKADTEWSSFPKQAGPHYWQRAGSEDWGVCQAAFDREGCMRILIPGNADASNEAEAKHEWEACRYAPIEPFKGSE